FPPGGPGCPVVVPAGDTGADLLGVLAGSEVADAVQATAGNVPEQAPEFGVGVGDLFAVVDDEAGRFFLLTVAGQPLQAMNLVGVELGRSLLAGRIFGDSLFAFVRHGASSFSSLRATGSSSPTGPLR